eukprot:CAMPEP_0115039120 /NCGR_PEP_ID=MMETSP0216-20121206/43817_1 /TAXON_ID=223996 /ORGANISM="Protocruzia adherens, Strain Boccale" /LENGTH=297 /DNA_ID=CAMNT_0002419655 /DNA_START=183 /DNA_END=1073 /DNA_ORIENTATION=-
MAMSLAGSLPLNVNELVSMEPPDDSTLHELSQDKIMRWMKYQMDDAWLGDILGETKPSVSDGDRETIDKAEIKDFLVGMGKSYVVKGLQGVKSLSEKFDQTDVDKALYYWAGDGDTSIGKSPHYSALSNLSARQAFGQLVDPNFEKYMQGYQGHTAAEWGEAFYNKLIGPDVFPALCADVLLGSRKRLNAYCMMLYLLAPDKSYSTDLNTKVLFGNVMKYFDNLSTEQEDEARSFIHDSLKDLILKIANDDSGTYPALKKEIADAMQEAGIEQGKLDAQMVEQYMLNMQTVITDMMD